MKQIILLFILLYSFSINGQHSEDQVKIYSLKLTIALTELEHYFKSLEVRKNYIEKFPDKAVMFREIFDSPPDNLYSESHKYIFKLTELWESFPELVGNKLIRLCIEFKQLEADAIWYIQHITIQYANEKYDHFISLIKQLKEEDLKVLITFLADAENHDDYLYYKKIVNKLKTSGEHELAKEFEIARELRIKSNHH